MILHLNDSITTADQANTWAKKAEGIAFPIREGKYGIVTSSSQKECPPALQSVVEESFVFPNDLQLASIDYPALQEGFSLGQGITLGGNTNATVLMTGPCSVESEAQINQAAAFCKKQGIKVLRGGCYKPRTSPYSFQGLGKEGLMLMRAAADAHDLLMVTEVRDATHVDDVIEYADIVQIGAKAMYDHGILRACGAMRKPVLLKRGFGSTLQEFAQAAEFILSGGNHRVMLCERGIRTFETKTRFTLDLCGVAWLKEHTNLPVIVDPSHAMGFRYGVPGLTRAAMAMGVDGLIIEAHPDPSVAKSDAAQQVDFETFAQIQASLRPIASAVGRTMV